MIRNFLRSDYQIDSIEFKTRTNRIINSLHLQEITIYIISPNQYLKNKVSNHPPFMFVEVYFRLTSFLNSEGVFPVNFLKAVLKVVLDLNPAS